MTPSRVRPTPGATPAGGRVRGGRASPAQVLVLALAVVAAACSGSSPSPNAVHVKMSDFHIAPSRSTVPAGQVSFDISSTGPTTHEFVVVRTALPSGDLPLAVDGITVDEDSPAVRHVGEEPNVDIGESSTLVLRLPAGHYVLFCNMEGHYLAGMHVSLTVT